MGYPQRRNQITTMHGGQNLRHHVWICLNCYHWHKEQKPRNCPCGNETFEYFMSTKEATRAAHLLMQRSYNIIDTLEFHPSYEWIENGVKVFCYRPDARYRKVATGEIIVEDVKNSANPKAWDPVFVLKKKLIEARFGFQIIIVTGR